MQVSGASSAMMSQSMSPNMGQASTNQAACGGEQGSTPLNDAMETGKMLGAALMMSVLFGEDGNDEKSKESDPMAMMLMAAGASGGNSYNAMGDMLQGSSSGQNLNVTA
ncbi:MAG TPA: hypothetical protein DCM28_08490 [Phycisphaerales bacterium]|nr:hypothetical protein [Phycisphaerales bacterium]HCD34050.1 hypothetical protein [Phycisphaerales bacterium]|tara:strand:+ start:835 stop:1161 length:327 start_codon:yes stop_codon:yes gene_type:complete